MPGEAVKLIQETPDLHDKFCFQILIETGMRVGDLHKLKRRDFDVKEEEGEQLYINKLKSFICP